MKRRLLLRESCVLEQDSCRTVPLEVFKSWNTIFFPGHLSGGRQELKGRPRAWAREGSPGPAEVGSEGQAAGTAVP